MKYVEIPTLIYLEYIINPHYAKIDTGIWADSVDNISHDIII